MILSYPKDLPISARQEEIVDLIRNNQVVVVAGDTGSGKTTQLPKMCLAAGRGSKGLIGCTQPRRIAAVSIADRVSEELGSTTAVGYKIRFNDKTSDQTRIKFMTDGILLAETQHDRNLKAYDTLIIDEAHERSLNIDFLLGYLKNLLLRRPSLKVIISSATIDTRKFSEHFSRAPIIEVSGRLHPIEYSYLAADLEEEQNQSYVEQALKVVLELTSQPGGDILVFMPTERDIRDTIDGLVSLDGQVSLLPLFGRLQAADQRKIFQRSPKRKIVVATNVAETSITVPGISFVVDTGLARISKYHIRSGTTSLRVTRVSTASCDQRAGRCGRTGPGTCFRLYSEEDYKQREDFTLPEIQRSNLAEVILQMTSLKLGDPHQFPFIDRPSPRAISNGYRSLRELGALNEQNQLTKRGRTMSRLPLDPSLSRIILEGNHQHALKEIKILAAALSIADPRVRPSGSEGKADAKHQEFRDKNSDFLTLLNIWNACMGPESNLSMSKLSKFCKKNYLSWQRMREWVDVHDQINRLLRNTSRMAANEQPASAEAIHKSITAGYLRNICYKKEKNLYLTGSGKEVRVFPGSAIYNRGGQWLVAASFIETSQLFARPAANIRVDWLEALGGHLCKRSWSEPHWEKKSGQVKALEKLTLFGHTIVQGRKVPYARISDEARKQSREIFIHSALVDGELAGKYDFLEHNNALIKQVKQLEERVRRRNIMVTDETLYDFYAERLPDTVYDRYTLNHFLGTAKNEKLLQMTEEDISAALPADDELYRYPTTLTCGAVTLQLSYQFEPGNPADGVTAIVPTTLLPQLKPAVFEWLVPGMLEEKILYLLKRLPKQLRKRLVPLPTSVDTILDSLDLYHGSLYQALEHAILRIAQMRIQRKDWQTENLPTHLKMRFQVVDGKNVIKGTYRSFSQMMTEIKTDQSTLSTTKPLKSLPEKGDICPADFNTILETVPLRGENGRVQAIYSPVLVLDEAKRVVNLRYSTDTNKGLQQSRVALHFLYCQEFKKETSALKKQCKSTLSANSASWLSLGANSTGAELRQALFHFILESIFKTKATRSIPTREEFQQQVNLVHKNGMLRSTLDIIDQITETLKQRRITQTVINNWVQRGKKNKSYDPQLHGEFKRSLKQTLAPDFLLDMDIEELNHKPRFLKALARRVERAEHSPAKDRKKATRMTNELKRLQELGTFSTRSLHCLRVQKEYRLLVEEFNVSIFAPELGTSSPVSEKKLTEKWLEVENLCRVVE